MKTLALLVVFAPVFIFAANEDVPRVAILGQGNAAAFADVLNAALSPEAAFTLVERAELDRLAGESALISLGLADRPIALARLAKADAFLFISLDETDQQHPLLVMRLTQTSDARVLHGLALPWLPKELETNSKFAVAQFAAPLKRLALAGGAAPLTVSLLGLRAAIDDPKLRSFETSLNLLLAHRLAAEPSMALMERWRLDDVVFERSLAAMDNLELATGAMLVDGSFTGSGTQVELRLRLRNAESDAGSLFTVQGSTLNTMPLVEAIVGHIAKRSQNKRETQTWQPQQEARAYADMGTWMVKHWLAPQAAEAFESAIALGNNDPLTFVGRAQAYAISAFPTDLRTGSAAENIRPESFPFHLAAAIRAVGLAADYLEANPDPSDSQLSAHSLQNPATLGHRIFLTGARTLQAVHDAGRHLQHQKLVADLRASLLRLVERMDASSGGHNHDYNDTKVRFAAYWCKTPQETLKYYQTILALGFGENVKAPSSAFKWSHYLRFITLGHQLNGPFLETKPENDWVEKAYIGTRRLIDWDELEPQRATQLWRDFIASLRASSSSVAQADGLAFEIASSLQLETRLRLLHESIELLWKYRSVLTEEEGVLMIKSLRPQFPNETGEFLKASKSYVLFLSLCCDLFEKESWVPDDWLMMVEIFRRLIAKEVLSNDDMRRLIAAMTGYEKRFRGDARQNERVTWTGKPYLETFTKSFNGLVEAWPQLADAPAASSSSNEQFKVTRYWNLFRQVSMEQEYRRWRKLMASSAQRSWDSPSVLNSDGTLIWLSHEKAGILRFDPRTLQTEVFGTPPGNSGDQIQQIVATTKEICAASRQALWRCERSSKQWTKIDVPEAPYSLGRNGDQILVAYASGSNSVKGEAAGAGVGRLTPSGVQWLVSTRRRPVEHALDAIDVQELYGVFAGPGGSPWISLREYGTGTRLNFTTGRVYSLEEPDTSRLRARSGFEVFPCGDRTVLWETWSTGNPMGQRSRGIYAWCVRPAATEPEALICSELQIQLPPGIRPRWSALNALENLPPDSLESVHLYPTMHGDELWMLYSQRERNKEVQLIGMLPGRKVPVFIPLSFVLSQADRAAVPPFISSGERNGVVTFCPQKHGVIATDYALGLCSSLDHGVWIIPWTDIRDWITRHPEP